MLSSATRFRARGTVVLSLFVLAVIAAACGGGREPRPAGAGAATGAPGGQAAGPNEQPKGDQNNGGGDGSGGQTGNLAGGPTAPEGLLIIKTGAIALQVGGLDPALTAANQLIIGLGGYTSGSERSGDERRRPGIGDLPSPGGALGRGARGPPRDRREGPRRAVVDRGRDLAGRRPGARIRNLQATERALQAIMDQATAIKDVLTVQAELTRTSERDRAARSTEAPLRGAGGVLDADRDVRAQAEPGPRRAAGLRRRRPRSSRPRPASSRSSRRVATAGIWFGIVWLPIIFTLALIALVGASRSCRRFRPVAAASPPGVAAPAADA